MQGDAAGALADFRRAVEMDGSYAEPWNNSGLIRHNLGQLTEAAADFDLALALRPDYAEALTNRGRVRQQQGDLACARADYDRALACSAGRFVASGRHNRGALRQRMGDLAGAVADFDRALQIDPEHVATYVHRGMVTRKPAISQACLRRPEPSARSARPPTCARHSSQAGRAWGASCRRTSTVPSTTITRPSPWEPDNPIYYISRRQRSLSPA